jgi:hypothetical protein
VVPRPTVEIQLRAVVIELKISLKVLIGKTLKERTFV